MQSIKPQGSDMATLVNRLCSALDNFYARHPISAFALMILIAFVCMVAIAALNQDGSAVPTILARTA